MPQALTPVSIDGTEFDALITLDESLKLMFLNIR